jgi:hypothetical protein
VQRLLEVVVDLGAHPQAVAQGRRARRDDHELLEVDAVVGVRAAVEHVHHRHRQHVARRRRRGSATAAGAPRPPRRARPPARRRGSAFAPRRDLFGVPSRLDELGVQAALVEHVDPAIAPAISGVDVADGLRDALAHPGVASRRAARSPRTRPSTRRWARRRAPSRRSAGRSRPRRSGLPRLSRIWRAWTRSIWLTLRSTSLGRSTGACGRPAGRSSRRRPARRRPRRGRGSDRRRRAAPARGRPSACARR